MRIARARERLWGWYDPARRGLPWRGSADPYAVWVAEVMLQQTRVETVRERWGRFLGRFPTIAALAAADEQALLKEWEGLGYYRRARNLRAAAVELQAEHGGALPRARAALERLPGFGPYTAAAVASIAFGQPEAVLDGNVERVLCRWDGVRAPARAPATRAGLAALAQRLLDPARPGDWNQALMDLGATVCRPRAPLCPRCPWRAGCRARAAGDPEALPVLPRAGPLPHRVIAAGLVWRGRRLLIARRPADGLLGGLWEFPGGKQREGEPLETTCAREVLEETGLAVQVVAPFLTLEHAYTHFRITLHLFHCRAGPGRPRALACESPRFVALHDLSSYPFPRANARALETLLRAPDPRPWAAPLPRARRARGARRTRKGKG